MELAVLELKNEGYDIKLHCAIPCKNHSCKWIKESVDQYNYILSKADIVKLVSDEEYKPWLMQKRNEYMVDLADRVIASGEEGTIYSKVTASKAADTMLSLAGIEATFVIVKVAPDKVAISARSRSKINVQRMMEELGGGGHFTLAACQLSDVTVAQAEQSLITVIDNDLKENMEVAR